MVNIPRHHRSTYPMRHLTSALRLSWLLIISATLNGTIAAGQSLEEYDADYLQAPADGPDLDAAEQLIAERTSAFRIEQGLRPVEPAPKLMETARYFAAYMARTDDYGHHADGNRPSERVALHGYDFCIVAENIGYQFDSTGFSAEELGRKFFEGWQNSPPHRRNMLDPHVTQIGVAIGHSPETDRYYAVQLFGRPKSDAVRFEVTNRTGETLRYKIDTAGQDQPASSTFELPPRGTMMHVRCRPATLDWQWTEKGNDLKAANGRQFVLSSGQDGIRVEERPISSGPPIPQSRAQGPNDSVPQD
jgi:uncharacterized protein YkwD